MHEMLLMQSSVLCISAAQELSKLITKNLQRENSRLPEWWHIIFCKNVPLSGSATLKFVSKRCADLYTCATVILASRCCPPLREKIGEAALQSCWTECVDGLRVYQECSLSARRCCRLLELFDQRTKNGQPGKACLLCSYLFLSSLLVTRYADDLWVSTKQPLDTWLMRGVLRPALERNLKSMPDRQTWPMTLI